MTGAAVTNLLQPRVRWKRTNRFMVSLTQKRPIKLAEAAAQTMRRWIGWDTLGVFLSVVLVTAAGFALIRLLHGVDFAKVQSALLATPPELVAVAAASIAASYLTLTFYDFFALRTIGRTDVPYRVAALTSFLGYTIGHNVGATVFTAGFVRFRIYKGYGLTVTDIAKIAFVTGLTFWLGNTAMLGAGLLCAPATASELNELPLWLNQCLGAASLAAISIYVAWLIPRQRTVGRNGWTVTLPSAPSTLVQIAIGITDLSFAAFAMYLLVAAHAPIGVRDVTIAYVLAALLGFASHAPGGLGVFDAAMLLALPQIEKEPLLAALLVFRAIYFLAPFCVAVLIFGGRELYAVLARR
jgi:uncharacterized membrane protein YbhN (UPF0104 family)